MTLNQRIPFQTKDFFKHLHITTPHTPHGRLLITLAVSIRANIKSTTAAAILTTTLKIAEPKVYTTTHHLRQSKCRIRRGILTTTHPTNRCTHRTIFNTRLRTIQLPLSTPPTTTRTQARSNTNTPAKRLSTVRNAMTTLYPLAPSSFW